MTPDPTFSPNPPHVHPQDDGSLVVHLPAPMVGDHPDRRWLSLMDNPVYQAHLRLLEGARLVQKIRDVFRFRPGLVSFDVGFWWDEGTRRTEPEIEAVDCQPGIEPLDLKMELLGELQRMLADFPDFEPLITDILAAPLDRDNLDARLEAAWDTEFGEGDFARRMAMESKDHLQASLDSASTVKKGPRL